MKVCGRVVPDGAVAVVVAGMAVVAVFIALGACLSLGVSAGPALVASGVAAFVGLSTGMSA